MEIVSLVVFVHTSPINSFTIQASGDSEWAATFAFGRKRLGLNKVIQLGTQEENVLTHVLLHAAGTGTFPITRFPVHHIVGFDIISEGVKGTTKYTKFRQGFINQKVKNSQPPS